MWQRLKFAYGLKWTRRSIIETIACFIVITFMLWAGVWLYIQLTDYANVRNEAYLNGRLADIRDKKIASILNGDIIATEPAGFNLHNSYYCTLDKIPFSDKN